MNAIIVTGGKQYKVAEGDVIFIGKNGKFKPWILRMCGPVAISSFLIYQSSLEDMSMTFKIIYIINP